MQIDHLSIDLASLASLIFVISRVWGRRKK